MWFLLLTFLVLATPAQAATRTIAWTYSPPTLTAQTFVVQRRIDAAPWADIATMPARLGETITYVDATLPEQPAVYEARYRVFAQQGTTRSPASPELSVGIGGAARLPQTALTLTAVDSEETQAEQTGGPMAIDNKADTFWHTLYSVGTPPPQPHWIVVDLGKTMAVDGIAYVPRQDQDHGRITDYEVDVSDSPTQWSTAVKTGTWPDGTAEQLVRFTPTNGRYVRLLSKATVQNRDWTSVAELAVFAGPKGSDVIPPPTPGGEAWVCTVEAPSDKVRIMKCVLP